jgi:hypothetical protein
MQRSLTAVFLIFGLCQAASADYEEVRELTVPAEGIEALQVEAGAGSLSIRGSSSTDAIIVVAQIRVPGADEDEARELIADRMVLSLERKGSRAELRGRFERGIRLFGDSPGISLDVRLPPFVALDVEDGSGSIVVEDMSGDIEVDDGSGAIRMTDVGGTVSVTDGSGPISIEGAGGDVRIADGSGSISVERADGSVTIDDGSGSISVADVAGDLIIPEAGSGAVTIRGVRGRIERGD